MVGLIILAVVITAVLWANGIHHMNKNHPDYKGEDLFNEQEEAQPIYKFNNGRGAMLCNVCRTIMSTGPKTQQLYCDKCKREKEVHFSGANLNK